LTAAPDPGVAALRDDGETMSGRARCPVCGTVFVPVGRQVYCANACRQVAHRRRLAAPGRVADVPEGQRREHSVYECSECSARYHARQWCEDCHRPCRRLGVGGECVHCGEPVTVGELLGRRA
jgi:hypothetical protein